ncbi:6-carboxytetrahydropterin synthase [Leuconostoc lactis]|uniref:6-carboxytetrahydropterin synthase n=1 Tax=Leuconostoc lactis TaxID=1246 RepID=UPI0008150669|nr:6-carboxytetrahydropterin synthase [Leuconostoc lactis]ANY11986.1 6-pyruvoyl tetrahydropterin synthase [Leuconostoc lactis]MCT8388083.1 6-pyruvoyl tetrahydropterin synthase [Leuconostoc lactis]GEB39859.1 6-pyruvoyltetrahydropterin synthase [Leuconostoc lactis]GLY45303.1 6-pyruvoyltetrahydropterin synthase [Leuconostoc lactis]HCH60075.1 6-pyruvoyl tetrahydropterin synthase [Leuconostoc lactis]
MGNKVFTYKLSTFINASHAVRWPDEMEAEHRHTWELILNIRPITAGKLLKIDDIEEVIEASLQTFSGRFLNDMSRFDNVNPTLENFTEILFDDLTQALSGISMQLVELSVGNSPTRFYHITLEDN